MTDLMIAIGATIILAGLAGAWMRSIAVERAPARRNQQIPCQLRGSSARPAAEVKTSQEPIPQILPALGAVAIQTTGNRDYPIWSNFAGTYFAFNPPWMLELHRRNSPARDDRRRYRQYLATHVRRYIESPGVETAHYIFTEGGLKRHPQQIERFTQFLRDLKDFSGWRWREIGSRISILEVPEGDEAKYAATVFSGVNCQNGISTHKTIAYLDIDGFCTTSGIPSRTLVIDSFDVFRSLENLHDRMTAHPKSRRFSAEEWLEKVWPERGCAAPSSSKWPQTFISYSHKNDKACLDVKLILEREGFNPWSDHDIGSGLYWRAALDDKLKDVNCCVLLLSQDSANSQEVRNEIEYLKPRLTSNGSGTLRARILVLNLDGTPLPDFVSDIQSKISLEGWDFRRDDLPSHIPFDKRTFEIAQGVESFLDEKDLL